MSSDVNTSVHSRIISAFFDTQASAKKAVDNLVAAGIPRQHITETGGAGAGTAAPASDRGFWDSLKDLFIPDEDRYAYSEGLRRGGYLVSVNADEANYDRVLDILDEEGAVNMDEREQTWKSEGWSGYQPGLMGAGVAGAATGVGAMTETNYKTDTVARSAAMGETTRAPVAPLAATTTGDADTVSLYAEELKVGKRDVNHGRVRLRSYVVETPVNESVSLHNETVSIDRRPVDRAVSATDAMFQDRTIELEEHAEEAVISKTARVTEEISLRKTAEDRVQTISDTVRRTEVEIEDERTGMATGKTAVGYFTQADATKIVAHMDVISADGQKIGTVDHLDGPDRIKLAKSTSPDGEHHYVPFAWIDHVDQHVHLNKSLAEIKTGQ